MTTINALAFALLVLVVWVLWGAVLFTRTYPMTNDELVRKIETGTLTRGEIREAVRVQLLLPALALVSMLARIGGTTCSRVVTNFVGLRLFKLPG